MKAVVSLIAYLCLSVLAHAGDGPTIQLDGVDITPAVTFFNDQVAVLKRPITVFNWSTQFLNNDAAYPSFIELSSKNFWIEYGGPKRPYNYGIGLYAAVDPAFTENYGAHGTEWLLSEMVFPVGFKFLDLQKTAITSNEVVSILAKFDCPDNTDALFIWGGQQLQPKCKTLVRKIFQDEVQIDGFAYPYQASIFKFCEDGIKNAYSRAIIQKNFVVTSPRWIGPDSVNYYMSNSIKNIEHRTLLQTIFFETLDQRAEPQDKTDIISEKAAAKTFRRHLLWDDLEGVKKASNVKSWMKENKLGCAKTLPY